MTEATTTTTYDAAAGPPLRAVHYRILRSVKAEDITWKWHGERVSYRLWTGEHEYRTLTAPERKALARLRGDGLIESCDGFYPSRGGFALTRAGHAVLDAAPPAASTP